MQRARAQSLTDLQAERLTKAGVLGCRTSPARSGTPSMGLPQEALCGVPRSSDWISAAAGVTGNGDACVGACAVTKRTLIRSISTW